MRLIIAGGRELRFPSADELVEQAFKHYPFKDEVTEIVHGGARGIDAAAGRYFSGFLPVKVFPADWENHGKSAGPKRNMQMAYYADALLAIWDGSSRGTGNMIDTAYQLGLKVHIQKYVGNKT